MKIVTSIILLVLGCIFSWYFLPEEMYETIGPLLNVNFIITDNNVVISQKTRALFSVVFGFGILFLSFFSVFRRSYLHIILGCMLVFVGLFIGIVINCIIFQVKGYDHKEVEISKALIMWVILPSIALVLSIGKYILDIINARRTPLDFSK